MQKTDVVKVQTINYAQITRLAKLLLHCTMKFEPAYKYDMVERIVPSNYKFISFQLQRSIEISHREYMFYTGRDMEAAQVS